MKNIKGKFVSILMTLVMVISILSMNIGSVFADESSKSINVNIAVVGMYNEILFSPQQISISENATAEDALKATGLKTKIADAGWIQSIQDQKNGTDDGYYSSSQSGWMYKINFMMPNDAAKTQILKEGDYVFFYYAKSYSDLLPSYDSNQNDFVNINVKSTEKDNSFNEQVTVLKNNSINAAIMEALKKHGGDFDKSSLPAGGLMSKDGKIWSYIVNDDKSTYDNSEIQLNGNDTITIFKDDGQGIKEGSVSVTDITLDKTVANLNEGDTLQLAATIQPDNATNKNITWASSDATVATVDANGKVIALKEGTTNITATTEDGQKTATCNVTVESKTIKITNMTTKSEYNLGDDAKISIKADNNSDQDQAASLVLALYDGKGQFVDYVSGNQTIKKGNSSILTGMIRLPSEGSYTLKSFIWDSMENMKPLSNVIEIPVK